MFLDEEEIPPFGKESAQVREDICALPGRQLHGGVFGVGAITEKE